MLLPIYIIGIGQQSGKYLDHHPLAKACILITTGQSKEFRYRLEVFQLSFEKRFKGEQLIEWSGEVKEFRKADDLILNHFS